MPEKDYERERPYVGAAKPLFILYGTASIVLLIFGFICWIFNLKL